MAKKEWMDEDSLFGEIIKEKTGVHDSIDVMIPSGNDRSNLPDAESKWATGRHCPKCAGMLKYFERVEESGVPLVQCSECKERYSLSQLENDEIYRKIPEDLVLRHVENMKRLGK